MTHQAQTGELRSPHLLLGDCAEQMRALADNSIDAIVTDPPYGIAFMGSKWDNFGGKSCGNDSAEVRRQKAQEYAAKNSSAPRYANGHGGAPTLDSMRSFQSYMTPIFAEALRVAKPGAYMCCFGSPRTYHRLTCAIEDAGWNVVDCVMFVHGMGFPKGVNISKAIDKRLGAERTEVVGTRHRNVKPFDDSNGWNDNSTTGDHQYTAPASAEAKEWDGFNSALKPAYEPIVIAQKPVEKTIIDNVLKHGTGAFNVDACRVPVDASDDVYAKNPHTRSKGTDAYEHNCYGKYGAMGEDYDPSRGRYPANLVHDGSPEVLALFPNTGKSQGGGGVKRVGAHVYDGGYKGKEYDAVGFMDSGSAARFFYCAKPSRKERGEGNNHPTVKSVALMRWLVRLVTRRGGIVLDPFMGSGTTGIAALQEGMRFVGIEREVKYMEIAKRRIAEAEAEIEQALEKERHELIQQELPL